VRKTFTTQLSFNDSLKIEQRMALAAHQMAVNGFPLDKEECQKQIDALNERIDWVDNAIIPFIPPTPKMFGVEVKEPFKLNGEPKKMVTDWYGEGSHWVDGPFSRIEWHPINLGSSQQVNKWLLENGWEPTEWNYKKDKSGKEIKDETGQPIKTSPKLTDESLEDLEELGQAGRLIAYRRKCTHKRNQLKGFLRDCREDGAVPSEVNTLGAATRRMTHRKIVNVPTPKKGQFWKDMRKCFWRGDEDHVVVGADLSQIQIRGLAHYAELLCNDTTLTDALIAADNGEGDDVHTVNAKIAGVTRDESKGIFYGYLFGSGIAKTAKQLGISVKKAKAIRAKFDKALPFLSKLVEHLIKFFRANGYITGLDGQRIYANSEHMLLVYLLQNFEAVVMKLSILMILDQIEEEKLDAKLATVQHDELQVVAHKDHAKRVGEIMEQKFKEAGTFVGSACPICGEAEIGNTWYDTH